MHITLVSPPQVFTATQVTAGVVPPLGLLYLAGFLKKQGVDVQVIDSVGGKFTQYTRHENITLRGLTFDEILSAVPARTDLIGVAALYSSAHLIVKELVAHLRSKFPQTPIVLGGAHATVLPEFVLRDTAADIVVLGEGELTLGELCQKLADYRDVCGIAYKQDGQIKFNPSRPLIADIDSLPWPDRSLIKMQHYFEAAEPHGCSASGCWTTLLSSRGCPFNCAFCTTPKIWQRHWRCRNAGDVISEMVELKERYGVTDFHFEDENMGVDKRWLHAFCDQLIARNLGITWQPSNGLRVESILDPGLLEKMKRSGCSLVVFTLESASERVRNQIIGKNLDRSNIEKAIALANRVGIKSTTYFMLGLPGERLAEAQETVRYIVKLARQGLDEPVISLFSMLPGCRLFDEFYQQGKIKLTAEYFRDLLAQGDLATFKSWNEHISNEKLKKLRNRGYLLFALHKGLFHPLKTIHSFFNILKGSDELKSERVVRTFIKRFLKRKGRAKRDAPKRQVPNRT